VERSGKKNWCYLALDKEGDFIRSAGKGNNRENVKGEGGGGLWRCVVRGTTQYRMSHVFVWKGEEERTTQYNQ